LEMLHAANLDAVSGPVAVHYEQAGLPEQAIQYYQQAAAVSRRILAYGEATGHLKRGLAVLAALPVTAERQQQELALLIALGTVMSATKGYATLEVGEIYARAYELCQRVGDPLQTFVVQQELRILSNYRGEWRAARQLAVANLSLAQKIDDSELLQHAHKGMGTALHLLGELTLAHTHFEEALRQPVTHHRFDQLFLDDAFQASLRTSVLPLWLLGYPDQARTRMQETLTLSQQDGQSIRYVMHLYFAARLHYFLRERALVQQRSEEIIALCTKQGFSMYWAVGVMFRGWVQALQGEWTSGIAQLQQSLAAQKATGNRLFLPYELAMLGEAHHTAGQYPEGLAAINEALVVVEQTGERIWQAELFRLQGELLLALGGAVPGVESCYRQAIDLARQQCAKALELRATVSLVRLWQSQDRQAEARQLLAAIYGWFSEGFDTLDLQAAQALMEELS
jgi:predicted ATPase